MPEPMCLNGYVACQLLLDSFQGAFAMFAALACLAAVLLGMAFVKALA